MRMKIKGNDELFCPRNKLEKLHSPSVNNEKAAHLLWMEKESCERNWKIKLVRGPHMCPWHTEPKTKKVISQPAQNQWYPTALAQATTEPCCIDIFITPGTWNAPRQQPLMKMSLQLKQNKTQQLQYKMRKTRNKNQSISGHNKWENNPKETVNK